MGAQTARFARRSSASAVGKSPPFFKGDSASLKSVRHDEAMSAHCLIELAIGLCEPLRTLDRSRRRGLLCQARREAAHAKGDDEQTKRRPRRQALPEHLRRVEYQHEPESTTCPTPDCGQAMVRIGEDITEKLDIVPAEFFVNHHVRGKWACRCYQVLVQPPVEPQVIDKGMPAAGLVAYTLVSRFVDHIPYYRQETINASSGVHTPRSTPAAWSCKGGAALHRLFDVQKEFVLGARVPHADETPVNMLDPIAFFDFLSATR